MKHDAVVIEQARCWIASRLCSETTSSPQCLACSPVQLCKIAESEGVAALLAYCLPPMDRDPVEEQVFAQLRAMELSRAGLDVRRQQEVMRVLALLEDAGIGVLLLKGEALAYNHYPESHLRSRSDVDMLVASCDEMERAWCVLQTAGYKRKNTLSGRFTGFQFACHCSLADGVEMQFDIHREISDFTWFARHLPCRDLFANSVTFKLAGIDARALDPRYALMHACLHRVANKPHGTQDRLIWLYDIHLLVQGLASEWAAFVSLAQASGMSRICLQGITAARRYLYTDIDLTSLSLAAESEPVGLSNATSRRALYFTDWRHNPGIWNKLAQLREHILPSPNYMRRKYGFQSVLLLPAYYVVVSRQSM